MIVITSLKQEAFSVTYLAISCTDNLFKLSNS